MLQSRAHGRKRGARTPKDEAGAVGGEAVAEETEVIVGAEVVVIGVPTGVGAKEGGEADSGVIAEREEVATGGRAGEIGVTGEIEGRGETEENEGRGNMTGKEEGATLIALAHQEEDEEGVVVAEAIVEMVTKGDVEVPRVVRMDLHANEH